MGRHVGRRVRVALFGILAVSLGAMGLAACGGAQATSSTSDTTLHSQRETSATSVPVRLAVTPAAQGDVPEAVSSNNAFSLDFFRAVRAQDENLVCSPYSLSLALTMTMAGARGQTKEEMKQTLRVSLPYYRLNAAMNALDRNLSGDTAFTCANSVWGQAGRAFKQPFVNLVARYYGAQLSLLDMDEDYVDACKTINAWVNERTDDRITDLMDPSDKPETKLLMMLVNAVHFKSDWLGRFWPGATEPEPFYLLDGRQAAVPMMHRLGEYRFIKAERMQAVELPYEGERFAMVILMPGEGRFEDFAGQADAGEVEHIVDGLGAGRLDLRVPSFEITSTPRITEALQTMGMTTAFTAAADLTGIADPVPGWPPWLISDVEQKAFIKVDEQGTEAAAATGVTTAAAGTTTTAGPPVKMTIDHPFVYLIRDTRSGAIVFIGQVIDPR